MLCCCCSCADLISIWFQVCFNFRSILLWRVEFLERDTLFRRQARGTAWTSGIHTPGSMHCWMFCQACHDDDDGPARSQMMMLMLMTMNLRRRAWWWRCDAFGDKPHDDISGARLCVQEGRWILFHCEQTYHRAPLCCAAFNRMLTGTAVPVTGTFNSNSFASYPARSQRDCFYLHTHIHIIYLYIYTHIYYICTCIHLYIYIYITYRYTYIHRYIHTHIHTHTYLYIYIYIIFGLVISHAFRYIHTHTYIYIYTYIDIYI